ncbi:hypothetical protein J8273_0471 [Carpediemonas membranifera]|uniref:Reverse transcriptase domain-containing protein n=1 Tax=Carpediemonas membranifera TaxID=201153 RepID=A0A8J6AZL3_9EUKA|nr:hypothetical protein J8273_0471 [Carpediemonas membranifera]|eukprot:KAG9395250.1 hypothetical protein J8273_0471 [Carpediemonas membranifera]
MFVDETSISAKKEKDAESLTTAVVDAIMAHKLRISPAKNVVKSTNPNAEVQIQGEITHAAESGRYLGLWIASGPRPLSACIAKKREQSTKYIALARRAGWTKGSTPAAVSKSILRTFL